MSEAAPRVPAYLSSGQVIKTFLTWLALMLVFAAIYGATKSKGPWGNWMIVATMGVVGTITLLFSFRANRLANRFLVAHAAALGQIQRGELETARNAMWAWSERARHARIGAVARHTLGWTLMRQNELDDAAAVLDDNEANLLVPMIALGLAATSAADLALVHALRGELDKAEAWLARAEERREKSRSPSIGAMLAFSRAVWLCRKGERDGAAKLHDEGWAGYEASFTGDVLRPLRVVRAFAQATGPRSGGVAEAALPTLRPAYPGEYTFLGTKWPEMAAFLACHELS
jgi:hypothetical protein